VRWVTPLRADPRPGFTGRAGYPRHPYIPVMRLLHSCVPLLSALCIALPASAQKTPVKQPPKAPAKAGAAKDTATKPAKAPEPEAPKFGYLQGVAVDSIRGEPLIGALVQVEGTGRISPTDSIGRFLVDSVPPGRYRVVLDHPLLDTLGITLVTDTMSFTAGAVTRTLIAVPDGERLAAILCPAGRRALGPGALVGRVREPDTDEPAVGARVSFVYFDPDPPGIPSNIKVKKSPRVREATVGADGTYRICGLPATFEGKLQAQRKDGGATAEVLVELTDGVLALRSMSVAAAAITVAKDTSGKTVINQKGTARVFGRVLNANNAPVVGARVGLMGSSAAAITRADGTFVLDSLPSGTQALVVRQIGYRPTEHTVELSARIPARANIKLGAFVPELSAVEVVSRREEGLQRVGYRDRKRSAASGHFIDPETIEKRNAQFFTDLLRTVPGIRVVTSGQQSMVYSTRSASQDGCVTTWVDGSPWRSLEAGDLDSFVQPPEVAAIEVYQGTNIPAQFQSAGSNCAVVVVWTKTRVDRRR
jgi:hypothetical protein